MNNKWGFYILLLGLILLTIGVMVYIMWSREGREDKQNYRSLAIGFVIAGIILTIIGVIWMLYRGNRCRRPCITPCADPCTPLNPSPVCKPKCKPKCETQTIYVEEQCEPKCETQTQEIYIEKECKPKQSCGLNLNSCVKPCVKPQVKSCSPCNN